MLTYKLWDFVETNTLFCWRPWTLLQPIARLGTVFAISERVKNVGNIQRSKVSCSPTRRSSQAVIFRNSSVKIFHCQTLSIIRLGDRMTLKSFRRCSRCCLSWGFDRGAWLLDEKRFIVRQDDVVTALVQPRVANDYRFATFFERVNFRWTWPSS